MKKGKTVTLEEVCNVEYGARVVQKRDGGKGFPVYGGGGATFEMDSFNREDRLVIARFGISEECTRFVTGKFFLNDSGLTVSPKNGTLLQRFLDYQMLSRNDDIYALGKGTAQKNLDVSVFRTLPLFIPNEISEQQWIVTLLDEAFASIATAKANAEKNLQNARALFESHLQSVFAQNNKGWAEGPFSELCDIKHGYAFEGEFFSSDGEYVLLTPGNFYETGGYRDRGEKQKYYTGEVPRAYILSEGDLLVAMTEQAAGLLGSPILVPESDKFLHNQRLGLVIPKPGVPWTNEFFFHVFNTQAVRKKIHASASGVKVRHTSPTKIGEVVVLFPTSLSEQRSIVSTLEGLREETQRLESIYKKKLAALEELKKSLLHQAFTGELTKESSQPVVIEPLLPPIPNFTPIELHAGILAMGYQAWEQVNRQWSFGHVMAEKFSHMTEALTGLDLGRKPVQDHFGPDDFPHFHKLEHRARMANYFTFKDGKKGKIFVKGRGFESLVAKTRVALGDLNRKLDEVIKLMLPMDMQQAEIFATVWAAWNNLLLDGLTPTDEQIVLAARENWHPDKLKIERERFFGAIDWIRKKNICPQGKWKRVLPMTIKNEK